MKVRCIKWQGVNFKAGKEYEVDNQGYIIGERGYQSSSKWWNYLNDKAFEKVKQMTKSDLVPGKHVVVCSNGENYLYIGNDTLMCETHGFNVLSDYNEDLTIKGGDTSYDINSVKEVTKPNCIQYIFSRSFTVWCRESPEQSEYNKLMEKIEELKAQAEKLKP